MIFLKDLPELINDENADISDDSDEEKWEEIRDDKDEEETTCLFCDLKFSSIEKAIPHLDQVHHFDLKELKGKYLMDFYSYIKVCIFGHSVSLKVLKTFNFS